MKQLINNWLNNNRLFNLNTFKQAVFVQNCLLCDAPQASIHAVCRPCLNDLPWQPKTSCPQCGLSSSGQLCGSCISAPPDFDITHSVFLYEFPIDKMMQRYKYGSSLNIGDTFGRFLAEKIKLDVLNNNNVDLIIPMPMHPQRLKERGFNQALEIAKVLSRLLTKKSREKLDFKSVARQTLTPPQASLPLKQRVKNIKGAFKVNAELKGKRIAIVDDVMTTGASLNELAKTLKKAGAAHVECWVIARTLPHK